MIKSMTGFASLTRDDDLATITVTVKAVNHRFLDLQLRVPGSLAAVETRIRSLVQSRVSRGRVEVSVSIQQRRTTAVEVELNLPFLDALKLAIERAREAGATFLGGVALHLRGEVRDVFFGWLKEKRPDLLPRYEKLYDGGRGYMSPSDRVRVSKVVRGWGRGRASRLKQGKPEAGTKKARRDQPAGGSHAGANTTPAIQRQASAQDSLC